ncbi:hypothetical protein V8C44DRAFT_365397 [Trichoderma aethiopicum]
MQAPSPEEAALYYYDGIRPGPKLIARTSSNVWDFSTRIYMPVTESTHPILLDRFFHNRGDGNGNVVPDHILGVLKGVDMTAITVVHHSDRNQDEWQTVLLVDVKAGTLAWEKAVTLALQCKELMVEFGIKDAECEIREAARAPEEEKVDWEFMALALPDDIDDIDDIEDWE